MDHQKKISMDFTEHELIAERRPESHKELADETISKAKSLAEETKEKAKALADRNDDKALTLATATTLLTKQVDMLTSVVKINNQEISSLRKEVDLKPDDSEVQFIAGLSKKRNNSLKSWAIGTALLAASVSGAVAWEFANKPRVENCREANDRIDGFISYYDEIVQQEMTNKFIDDELRAARVNNHRQLIKLIDNNRPEC